MSPEGNGLSDQEAVERFDHLAGECLCHDRVDDAISYYRQALAVRERVFGPDHCEVANNLVPLAGVLGWGGRESPETEQLYHRAVAIFERYCRDLSASKEHPFQDAFMGLVGTLNNLAGKAFRRDSLHEAEQFHRRIHALVAESYGTECRWVPPSLPMFALILDRLGKSDEAEQLLRTAIENLEGQSATEWVLIDCLSKLADLYARQHRFAEAEPLCLRAVALLERGSAPNPVVLAGALERLADLYRSTGRGSEAERFEGRVKEVRHQATLCERVG